MAGLIPNDYGTASEALHHGKPLTIMAPRTTSDNGTCEKVSQLIAERGAGNGRRAGKERARSLISRAISTKLGFEAKGKPSAV